MTRLRLFLFIFAVLLLAGAGTGWLLLQSKAFWTWGGYQLVDLAQDRLYPQLKVKEIRGHPLTGLTFTGISLTSPEGEVLKIERLELRFSLWSLVEREPVLALNIVAPHLSIWQNPDGSLNLAHLLKPRPPPPFQSINFPEVKIQKGSVEYRQAGGSQHLEGLDLQAAFSVLHPKRPEQAVLVRRASLTAATPFGRIGLTTRLTYCRQELNILALDVREGDNFLAAVSGRGRLGAAPAGSLAIEFGPLPGTFINRVFSWWPGEAGLQGHLRVAANAQGLELAGAGKLQDSPFQLAGRANWETKPGRCRADLELKEMRQSLVRLFYPALGAKIKEFTPFAAKLHLETTGPAWPPESLEGSLTATPFRLGAASVDELKLALSATGRDQSLKSEARGSFGRLSLSAAGPILTQREAQVSASAENLEPGLLGLASLSQSQLSGKFAGRFRLGSPAQPGSAVSGELAAAGRLEGYSLEEMKAKLSWQRSNLVISQASVHLAGLSAELKGSLKGEALDFQAQGRLSRPISAPSGAAKAGGTLSFSGALSGTWPNPEVRLSASGHHFSWAGWAADALTLQMQASGWPPRAGNLSLKASGLTTAVGAVPQAALYCQGVDNRWQFSLRANGSQGPGAEISGTADLSSRPFTLAMGKLGFSLGNVRMTNLSPVRVRLLPGLVVEPAAFRVNDGTLKLEARIEGQTVSGRLQAQDLPAQVIHVKDWALEGRLNAEAALSGTPSQPVLTGQLALAPGRWGNFTFQRFQSKFTYQNAGLSFSGSLEEKASGPRLVWDGQLPVRLTFSPFALALRNDEVQVLVQGQNVNLSLLSALTREVLQANGDVDLKAQWQGRLPNPRLTGHIRWGAGSFLLRSSQLAYRLPPGEMRLEGETLTLAPVTLESGGGSAVVRGSFGLSGFWPRQMDLTAQLNNFKVFSRAGSEGFGSGSVNLTGTLASPFLKGHLLVSRTTFRPAFFQSGINEDIVLVRGQTPLPPQAQAAARAPGASALAAWRMDLAMEAPGGVWVKDKRFNIEVSGQVRLTKQPGGPVVPIGTVKAVQGVIDIQDRPFKLTEGSLNLPGQPWVPITLQGRAINETKDVTLIMEFSGPVSKPEVHLSSIPPLPPEDLLSYLVFGRPAQALSQEQFRSVSEQAVGVFGGITAKQLQDFLGKDFPLVGDLFVKGSRESVGVAKPLTENLTVSIERKTDALARYSDENQVVLEYRINRHFSVESQAGRRNTGGDIFFNLDF